MQLSKVQQLNSSTLSPPPSSSPAPSKEESAMEHNLYTWKS